MSDLTGAVFISYASQDMEAAQRLKAGLVAAGIEVWLDQSELRGGDAWDQMIRRQIKSCALFIPLLSGNTRARKEGYFRLEWKLAVDRSHLMASEKAFLLPVAIDDSDNANAAVPERFQEVQWTSLPGGEVTSAFVSRVLGLLSADRADQRPNSPTLGVQHDPQTVWRRNQGLRRFYPIATLALILVIGGACFLYLRSTRIIPYSKQDRRMTYAVLPLRPASDDAKSIAEAKTADRVLYRSLEENETWVQLVTQASVAQALTKFSAPHDLANALDVHFLFRGGIGSSSAGKRLELYVVDGESERVLDSQEIPIPSDLSTPEFQDAIDQATGMLIFHALEIEVERARKKADNQLDVRDLTYRAFVDWGHLRMAGDGKRAYSDASVLLNRALKISPDDSLALRLLAKVNLCDCVEAWSPNIAEQQAIGEAAINRFLSNHPDDVGLLHEKARLYALRGRYQDALIILNSILVRQPENSNVMEDISFNLLKLGRPQDAAPFATKAYAFHNHPIRAALIADIDFALGDFLSAEKMAQQAIAVMSKSQLSNSKTGTIRLTLIAAAANLKHQSIVAATLGDLASDLPDLKSLSAIRKWMDPQSDLYGFEPLFGGLRVAGLSE